MDQEKEIGLNRKYAPSEKIVPRRIQGKLIIVPIEDGVADFNDAMFSFNETGGIIWDCIEQRQSIEEICATLAGKYRADMDEIRQGVVKLVNTLLKKGIITEWKN